MACTRQMLAEESKALREPSLPSERPSGQKMEGLSWCPVSFPVASSGSGWEVCVGDESQPAREVLFGVDERSAATGSDCNTVSAVATRTGTALLPEPSAPSRLQGSCFGRVSLSRQIAQLLVSNGAPSQRDPDRTR